MKKVLLAALSFILMNSTAIAQLSDEKIDSIRNDIADITARIAEANTTANTRDSTLIGVLARARAETLALTIAILEARLAGDEAGVVTKITFPIVAPDPDRAKDIEAEMAALEEVIAKAEVEVSLSKGLIQAVAVSRVQAEKLSLIHI